MKSLIIYAHPNPASFTNAIKNTVEEQLKAKGHEFKTRDLYATNFSSVLTGQDLGSIYQGQVPTDIKAEQELMAWADNYILIYPIWWAGMPAIMKGYIDRILTYGFAYVYGEKGPEGLLQGKNAVLITPHGSPKEYYEPAGFYKSMGQTQDTGIWEFCGVNVNKHFYFGMMNKEQADREAYLKEIADFFAKF